MPHAPVLAVAAAQVPDKVVLSHSRLYGSNGTYLTLAAHTGRSLWHSHTGNVGAVTSFWRGGARMLSAPGKHNFAPDAASMVVLVPRHALGFLLLIRVAL